MEAKVVALKKFFGELISELNLLPAVAAMNAVMGVTGEGALPLQVDALIAATGVVWAVFVTSVTRLLGSGAAAMHRFLRAEGRILCGIS